MRQLPRAKLFAAATTLLILLMACNPQLLPLVPLLDAVGLDVLALLLGAQCIALVPWVRAHASGVLRVASLVAGAVIAGFAGSYLRAGWPQVWNPCDWSFLLKRP
jgi:ABC-type uncharacterized transport system permease subunit